MNKKIFIMIALLSARSFLYAQVNDSISENEVNRIIHYLASDSLRGRGNITPDILNATVFIEEEFRKSKLLPLPGMPYLNIAFRPYGGSIPDEVKWNDKKLRGREYIYLHKKPGSYREKTLADFKVVKVDSFFGKDLLTHLPGDSSSLLLWSDQTPPGKLLFPEILDVPVEGLQRDVLMVYADQAPLSLSVSALPKAYLMTQYNVVGVLPGRSKADEVIIFSAHYDHMGVYGRRGDTILNGANDNASGTTALLLLAQYFAKRNDNERTIMFCAFSGEELGLLGSKDFVPFINPQKIKAGINLEMLGVPQYGKNTVFILGKNYSDLPDHLKKYLRAAKMSVVPEPDKSKLLFQRSDNYHFALQGIPFHTIMASDDDDRCYHRPCDELKRIDIANLTRITRAIAVSASVLVKGDFTPERINRAEVEIKN